MHWLSIQYNRLLFLHKFAFAYANPGIWLSSQAFTYANFIMVPR